MLPVGRSATLDLRSGGMNRADTKLMERVAPRETIRNAELGLQAGLLAILLGILYYDILARLVFHWWKDSDFSHGFLIPVFSAFVVWQSRKRWSALPTEPSRWGGVVIVGAMATLILGELGAEFFLSRSSLVFLIAGLVICFLGWPHFRAMAFAWAMLFFMIPIPALIYNQITFPLQFLAARLASFLLDLTGVPVLREGNIIQLPTMSLEVAQACSGVRSLMSLGALALIYGYFLETRKLPRVLLALAAIPIAVSANGLRVMVTGLLGYYWSPDKAEGFFHTFSGWVIFVISLVMLFCFHALLRGIRTLHSRKGTVKT